MTCRPKPRSRAFGLLVEQTARGGPADVPLRLDPRDERVGLDLNEVVACADDRIGRVS